MVNKQPNQFLLVLHMMLQLQKLVKIVTVKLVKWQLILPKETLLRSHLYRGRLMKQQVNQMSLKISGWLLYPYFLLFLPYSLYLDDA